MSSAKETILKVLNLSKSFSTSRGKVDAIKDITFEVKTGQFFGIIGESGSGKTTLGRSIIGLNDTSSGSVYFQNELINLKHLSKEKRKWKRQNIQMIFQDPLSSLNEKKNVLSIISEPLKINKSFFNTFNARMKENSKILVNFRFTLEKIYWNERFDYEKSLYKKAFVTYVRLEKLLDVEIQKLDSSKPEDIVDFLEHVYFKLLLDENFEILKNVRKLNTKLEATYETIRQRYLKNDMEKDEIQLKQAQERLDRIIDQMHSSLEAKEIARKLKIAENNLLELIVKYKKQNSFSRSFMKNFSKSIKNVSKDEFFKSSLQENNNDYQIHKKLSVTLKNLYKKLKKFPKNIVLTQKETDEIYSFKNVFFKLNAKQEQYNKGFEKINEIFTKSVAKSNEWLQEINETKLIVNDLKNQHAEQLKLKKEYFETSSVKFKEKLSQAKINLKEASDFYNNELVKAKVEMKKWRRDFFMNRKTTIWLMKRNYLDQKRVVIEKLKKVYKVIFEKLESNAKIEIENLSKKVVPISNRETNTDLITTKSDLKAIKLEFKVKKQNLQALIKNDKIKQKALEVEVDLEEKQINYTKALFGILKLPGFLNRYLTKRNFIIKNVKEMLVKVGLKPEHAYRYPHEFSGGQRQRIGIARAIITKPKMIIADEPISALDVSIQAQVINILRNLSIEFGCSLLFIAHDLSMVSYICDEIIIMSKGRILEKGDTNSIFRNPIHPYTKELLSSVPELSNVHKNLAEKQVTDPYTYESNKEYNFVQIGNINHYVLADEEQAKRWTKSE